MLNKKVLTPEQALQKLRHYCGYQERCHQEVKEKLFNLGIRKSQHDEIVSTLANLTSLPSSLRMSSIVFAAPTGSNSFSGNFGSVTSVPQLGQYFPDSILDVVTT